MFKSGRYLIVDDQPGEIRPLVEALHSIGIPCIGLHYRPESAPEKDLFAGVRLLFLDLHLIPGMSTDGPGRYATLATLLERCIHEQGGPYVIVLWTSHAEEHQAFTAYLDRALEQPYQRPLAVLSMDKNKYRGKEGTFDATALRNDVQEHLASLPQLQVLLAWEGEVLAACGAVLTELVGLIPPKDRVTGAFAPRLDEVLSQLAAAAAGAGHVAGAERSAVNGALAPLLQDRVMNVPTAEGEAAQLWRAAVTRYGNLPKLDPVGSGRMNRMLHLATAPGERCHPTDWGAVIPLPPEEHADEAMVGRFGITLPKAIVEVFGIKESNVGKCSPCLVRIGAVCDYAQSKVGPIPYVLGLLLPHATKEERKTPANNVSPTLEWPGCTEPMKLIVNARMQVTLTGADVENWQTACRIREQLLMSIIGHVAGHASRPGILKLPN